jgi:hypothetical protein
MSKATHFWKFTLSSQIRFGTLPEVCRYCARGVFLALDEMSVSDELKHI